MIRQAIAKTKRPHRSARTCQVSGGPQVAQGGGGAVQVGVEVGVEVGVKSGVAHGSSQNVGETVGVYVGGEKGRRRGSRVIVGVSGGGGYVIVELCDGVG